MVEFISRLDLYIIRQYLVLEFIFYCFYKHVNDKLSFHVFIFHYICLESSLVPVEKKAAYPSLLSQLKGGVVVERNEHIQVRKWR